jgi:uncharacterized protein (TIGR03435 family)
MRNSQRVFFGIVAVLYGAVWAQPSGSPLKFDVADVHVSPRNTWLKIPANAMQGGSLTGELYQLRRATMVDLIKMAYSLDAEKVVGGPSWIDYDRFDVVAKTKRGTSPEALRVMLQSLLADRFGLIVSPETKPMPAYVLSAGKSQPRLKVADGSGSAGCKTLGFVTLNGGRYTRVGCRNVTMSAFAVALPSLAARFLGAHQVMDSTGLEGMWDLELQFPTQLAAGPVTSSDLFEAIDKQLGLKLSVEDVEQPVLMVKGANEQPSANAAGIAATLASPKFELEVASIKPSRSDETYAPVVNSPGRLEMRGWSLQDVITWAWKVRTDEIFAAPRWLDSDHWDITGKVSADAGELAVVPTDDLRILARTLLEERFKLAVNLEDHPMDAYTLVASKPKLTPANPQSRTGCTRETMPPRAPGLLSARVSCQNMTMFQFAEQLQGFDSSTIRYPLLDATGIQGSWDFSFTFDLNLTAGVIAHASEAGGPTEPSPAVPLATALEKQLGLKLEKRKRGVRMLVIDHIEEQPTEN